MENAAKALEMAGGILIAILIISMFTYMFNHLSQHQAVNTYLDNIDKIDAFNAKYLAYDKTILYGADIISVINQALSNNISVTENKSGMYLQQRYGYFNSANPLDINIKFKLIENTTVQVEIYKKDETVEDNDIDTDGSSTTPLGDVSGKGPEKFSLKKNVVYDLTKFNPTGGGYYVDDKANPTENRKQLENNPILSIMPGEDIKVRNEGTNEGIYIKRQTKRFISKIFKCTGVEFSATTGQVREMTFEEFDPNETDYHKDPHKRQID